MLSSKEVNQMIEKESSRTLPNFIQVWNSTENEEIECICSEEKEYSNIFIDGEVHNVSRNKETGSDECISRIHNIPALSDEHSNLDQMKYTRKDAPEEMSVSKNVHSMDADEDKLEKADILREDPLVHRDLDNMDETDYFDSEDEYTEKEQSSSVIDKVFKSLPGEFHDIDDKYSRIEDEDPYLHTLRKSIKRFAEDNGFEIHDGPLDGACMFRSIADQLMINGRFGHSAYDLREEALEYLRRNPLLTDGTHTQYFLSKETWGQYLMRMQQKTEWGDHIVLKAIVNTLNVNVVVLNVKEDTVQRTELSPENTSMDSWRITLTLGHLGEFHYLSLRPKLWKKYWPYKAILLKLQLSLLGESSSVKDEVVSAKLADMGIEKLIEEAGVNDLRRNANNTSEDSPREEYYSITTSHSTDSVASLRSQYEFVEESRRLLVEDSLHNDTLSGVNLFKLSYFIKHLMPLKMMKIYTLDLPQRIRYSDSHVPIMYEVTGAHADRTDVVLRDISAAKTMSMHHQEKRVKQPILIAMDLEVDVQHSDHICDRFDKETVYHADLTETHPGYCRLRLADTYHANRKENSYFVPDIKEFTSSNLPYYCYKGFLCHSLPPNFRDWRYSSWPSDAVKNSVCLMKCAVFPKSHPKSEKPQYEWKYNFSKAESCLITNGLTSFQYHGLCILWIILENMTMHLQKPIKRKHLKAVFFNACEKIPEHAWETNIGGCFLFVISLLLSCLKKRYLPHYFIPSNNMIDCYSPEEIDTLCVYVEAIRLFPVFAIQSITEMHGYMFGKRLSYRLFGTIPLRGVKSQFILRNKMVCGTIDAVKFYTRRGYYGIAFDLLRDAHECILLGPESELQINQPSFLEFISAVIEELSQRSSRIILAKKFEKEYHLNISDKYEAKNKILARHILPWEVDYRLASIEIPENEDMNFQFLAEFFHSKYQENIVRKRNASLASVAIQIAVKCIDEAISVRFDISKHDRDSKPHTQEKKALSGLKRRKMHFLEDVYKVSTILASVYPIRDYVREVEDLCKELPEYTDVLREMLHYTGDHRMCKTETVWGVVL